MRGRPNDGAEDFLIRHFIRKTKCYLNKSGAALESSQ